MITTSSSADHGEALRRLSDALARRGLTVFAQIDHAAAAREVGMELGDETVVIFGNPRAGTPLMQQDPRVGIELPLRMLVWSADGGTMVGYTDPRELASTYELSRQAPLLEAMFSLLSDLAREIAG